MDPFWELFEDQFCTKDEKMRKRRMPKNRCRKKVTLRKNECLSPDPEADFCFENCPIWVETRKRRMLNLVRVEGSMI